MVYLSFWTVVEPPTPPSLKLTPKIRPLKQMLAGKGKPNHPPVLFGPSKKVVNQGEILGVGFNPPIFN